MHWLGLLQLQEAHSRHALQSSNVIFNVKWSVPGFAKPGYSDFPFRIVSGHYKCLCLKLNSIQGLGFRA